MDSLDDGVESEFMMAGLSIPVIFKILQSQLDARIRFYLPTTGDRTLHKGSGAAGHIQYTLKD